MEISENFILLLKIILLTRCILKKSGIRMKWRMNEDECVVEQTHVMCKWNVGVEKWRRVEIICLYSTCFLKHFCVLSYSKSFWVSTVENEETNKRVIFRVLTLLPKLTNKSINRQPKLLMITVAQQWFSFSLILVESSRRVLSCSKKTNEDIEEGK